MFDETFMVSEVDESMTGAEMQGPSSTVNQRVGRVPWNTSASRSLVMLWFTALGLYWLLGALFRGARSSIK